jgi:hypothetical protein
VGSGQLEYAVELAGDDGGAAVVESVRFFVALLAAGLVLYARDFKAVSELRGEAEKLSADEAKALEQRLEKKPRDEESRLKLVFYYSRVPDGVDPNTFLASYASHILYIVENDPKEGFGLFPTLTGVLNIPCHDGPLASPELHQKIEEAWARQVAKHPNESTIRNQALAAERYCNPEAAEKLLLGSKDRAALARFYAQIVLGAAEGGKKTDAAIRQGPLADRARGELENARDAEFVVAAATTLLGDGAVLWASGALDWDYSVMGKSLYERALQLDPENFLLATAPTALPPRGSPPPRTLRVGGNIQADQLIRKVTPRYPEIAKANRVSGTVRMSALLGLDGSVLKLHVESGPAELIAASVDAASQWLYKPTLLNGKPCYIITVIDINYSVERR